MEVITYLCDLCGKEITKKEGIYPRENDAFYFKLYLNKRKLQAELCKICYSRTVKFIIDLQKSMEI